MIAYIVIGLLSILLGGAVGYFIKIVTARNKLNSAENRAELILREAKLEAESKKKELLLEAKTFLIQERENFEKQTNDRRIELQRLERRLIQKEEQYEKRLEDVEKKEGRLKDKETALINKEDEVGKLHSRWMEDLERIAGLSTEEAVDLIKKELEDQARQESQILLNKIEEETKRTANKKSR
jgi:ribonuclease Y